MTHASSYQIEFLYRKLMIVDLALFVRWSPTYMMIIKDVFWICTEIICVLLCMIFVIQLFFFFVTALTMRNIVLLFALIAVALAADRCAVTNPIDCGYPGTNWHTFAFLLYRHQSGSLWDSWMLLRWWRFPLLLLSRIWSGKHHKGSHCSRLSLWCWLRRRPLHHHQPLLRYFLPCHSRCIPNRKKMICF